MNKDMYFIRVCEIAAINTLNSIGCKDKNYVDKMAVDSMKFSLNECPLGITIKSGEGYLDDAPMLKIKEKLGKHSIKMTYDLAVDPVENTNAVAFNKNHGIVCLAYGYKDTIKIVPETYMEKLFFNKKWKNFIKKDLSMIENILQIQKNCDHNISLIILDKPRHSAVIEMFEKEGIKVTKISNGDVVGAIAVVENNFDCLYGIGGSVEGVLMSALAISSGSYLTMKFIKYNQIWNSDKEDKIMYQKELINMKKYKWKYDFKYSPKDLIINDSVRFIATFLTDSYKHNGIQKDNKNYYIETFFSSHGITRNIKSYYDIFEINKIIPKLKPWFRNKSA